MKRYLTLFLVFLMVLGCVACGGGETETEGTTDTQAVQDTEVPTNAPTEAPTEAPVDVPTEAPTNVPTEMPVEETTEEPTNAPTEAPTSEPTEAPTQSETEDKTEETEEMESIVLNDGQASVGIYDEYDLDTYMSPIWDGKVVHNETVMFVGIDDKAPLLYDADRIISVRSYDLQTEYVQGVDYDYVDGKLVLLEGTRIPYVPLETYYSVLDPAYPYLSTMYNGKVTQTMFGDGTAMTKWQVAVTYKHSDTWEGPTVQSYNKVYADFIGKLERGEDVTVFFYGDSITTGATSSQSRAPYAPSFPRMFVQYVAKQYGYTVKYVDTYSDFTTSRPSGGAAHPDSVFGDNGTITYINTAVGGWSTQNGLDNAQNYVTKYINKHGCDLFVLAFGMNNGGSTGVTVANLLEQIVRVVYKANREADVVLVSTMIPNPEAVRNPDDKYYCNGNQHTFEEAMYPLANKINKNGISCAVAPMTSMSKYIHAQKRYRDTTGNNVNHPSDFLARTYAQVIYQTVFGYENYEKEPVELGETPVVDANYNAIYTSATGDLYIDGKQGTENANFASCVRIEACEGGYRLYFVEKGEKIYVNATSDGFAYDKAAKSVWSYNATLKAMTCEDGKLSVKLVTPEICLHPIVMNETGHYREACVRCGIEKEEGTHSFTETVTEKADGALEFATKCSKCGYFKSSYTIPAGLNQYYALSDMALYNATNGGIQTEDGVQYLRTMFENGDGHIFVNGPNNSTELSEDTGKYLVIKYRAANNSYIRFDICTSDNEGNRTNISKPAAKIPAGWEIAVIELAQFANYTCDSDLKAQIRITTGVEYIDIAYAAIVDSIDEAKGLMKDETYVLYADWSGDGVECKVSEPSPEESKEEPTEAPTEAPTEETTEVSSEEITENEPADISDQLASVGVYEQYDLDSYMTPVWDGKIVHNETVMFVGADDKAPLLYSADKIISVRSYDLRTEYVQGVDYDYVDGKLVLLEGTRIPYVPLETYYSVIDPTHPYLSTMYNGKVTQTMYGEGDAMTKWQVAVTYKHSDAWDGPVLKSYEDRYADFISKLENGEDVTVFFYGDSITTGATSSQSRAPYAPSFARMFVQYVARQYGYTVKYIDSYSDATLTAGKTGGGSAYADSVYGNNGTITYVNTAVGGWNTQQGRDNFDAYVKAYVEKYGCDMFVLAFGMNNGGSTANDVCGYLNEIVVKVEACAPDSDILLVSTMIPNPEAVRNPDDTYYCNGTQSTFEAEMIPLAEKINGRGTDCALAPMTSVSKYIHAQKRYRDTTGNNVNHPSDFLARTYAQVIYQTVFGYENYEKAPAELGEVPVINANYNGKVTMSSEALFLDGKSGTTDANNAVCVRLKACEGGYNLYFVKDSKYVYINADENSKINYSESAKTVWHYDAENKVMLSENNATVALTAPEICFHPSVAGESGHGREACLRCGVQANMEAHSLVESTTEAEDGAVNYVSSCSTCGYVANPKTVAACVKYYSAAAIAKSPIFYMLGHSSGIDASGAYARVTAGTSNHGHELHFVDQNANHHNDFSGKPLDTEGAQYVVIKLRASDELTMQFQYNVLGNSTASISLAKSALKAGEWVTFVIDLKAASADQYIPDANGTYVMHRFKIYFGTDFVGIENGYVDFAYMAVCDDWDEIKAVADQDELMLVTSSGKANVVTKDGECTDLHSIVESAEGNVYIWKCSACGAIEGSKTIPEGINVFVSPYAVSAKANGANLINFAEVICDEDGIYSRIYGGAAHATQNYNQFALYSKSSASAVTGQYLVIKYRVGENGLGQKKITIYAGTVNAGPTTERERIDLYVGDGTTVEDDTWHTAIIDMSTAAGLSSTESLFKATESDGLYRAKFVSVRPFYTGKAGGDESDYMDIAYTAICDSLQEAEALVEESSYEYYTNATTPEIVNLSK